MRMSSTAPRASQWKRALIGGLLLLPTLCFGALTWDTQQLEFKPKAGETQVAAVFHFRNTSSDAVTITSVRSSCDCTTTELSKFIYAPGESGEIKAVYVFEGETGYREKSIKVSTNDLTATITPLLLRVTIPELFTFSTQQLTWPSGSEPTEQSLAISSWKEIAEIKPGAHPPKGWICRVETIEAGKTYRLFIRPAASVQAAALPVPFTAHFADGTILPLVVHAIVR